MLSYVDDGLVKATQANSDWFYAQLFECFDSKAVQWLTCETPLDHFGMNICQDGEGIYISMQDYIHTMLVKLEMKNCSGNQLKAPMCKAIDGMARHSTAQHSTAWYGTARKYTCTQHVHNTTRTHARMHACPHTYPHAHANMHTPASTHTENCATGLACRQAQ